ncbi:DUF433 domain-containing protein [Methylobacterium isbiliense]|uniref:DUF433 domain-containing protein n=1 Tax=Methylobacterium isbiliense TaxID=315478 RepID=A0ABQ4SHK6_9HYPH|nr:DUF433 domain-containing protein [Methylobacterium isbiliense]MDN3627889.1 DUF433 domain-containing protein [Methylobacterium isbiliense]GJE02712.1 hypothetical protein GMJLKIPL_4661 [Methylobacterium isbiliense]
MLKTRALTANEAAAASRVPLKQVHRIIDAGLLEGAVEVRQGTRVIDGPGLVALKLAYVTADVLKPEARRRAVQSVLNKPEEPVIRDQAVTVEVGVIEAELEQGLAEFDDAKAMVSTDPEVMGGAPCFTGTRIPVHDIVDMMANGDTIAALAQAYPALDERRIGLASIYAAAYPRRGRPRTPPWRAAGPKSSERLRLADVPSA